MTAKSPRAASWRRSSAACRGPTPTPPPQAPRTARCESAHPAPAPLSIDQAAGMPANASHECMLDCCGLCAQARDLALAAALGRFRLVPCSNSRELLQASTHHSSAPLLLCLFCALFVPYLCLRPWALSLCLTLCLISRPEKAAGRRPALWPNASSPSHLTRPAAAGMAAGEAVARLPSGAQPPGCFYWTTSRRIWLRCTRTSTSGVSVLFLLCSLAHARFTHRRRRACSSRIT